MQPVCHIRAEPFHWCLQALEGLRVILGVRPQTLATMVPKLLRGTMTATNCKALGSLAEVAGPAIAPHLSNIFPPLLRLASQPDSSSPAGPAAKDALIKVIPHGHVSLAFDWLADHIPALPSNVQTC